MQAVVLAAGKGTRLKPLTDSVPKALVELNATPLLGHVLKALEQSGIAETIIVVGFQGEQIKTNF